VVLRLQMVRRKSLLQQRKRLLRRIGKVEKTHILRRNSSFFDKCVEVDYRLPVRGTINDDGDLLGQLLGLREGKNLKRFIDGSKPPGKTTSAFASRRTSTCA